MKQTRDDFVYEIARMYYFQNATMDSIARHLDTSRSTISRALTEARESGVVQIRLERGDESTSSLERKVHDNFAVNTHVVASAALSEEQFGAEVCNVAAQLVADWMRPGSVLAVGAGETLQSVVNGFPARPCPGSAIVQLHGTIGPLGPTSRGSSQSVLTTAAQAFGAEEHPFPVPSFFDFATTRDAMWAERSIQRIRAMQSHADVALFSVGAFRGPDPSWPYTSGVLSDEDLDELRRERVVGDVCTVMLRPDGNYRNVRVNLRTSGATPRSLRNVPRRLLVAFGRTKALPLLAALRSGIATDVVIDDSLAHAVLAAVPAPQSTGAR